MSRLEAPIDKPVLVLLGPTAVGKTSLSLRIAEEYSCEIVGLDSMQIYRYMDIGTAKATVEERRQVPHHLIDIVDPDEEYDVARYVADAAKACRQIIGRGKTPLLVGGTGLYLKAMLQGLFEAGGDDEGVRGKLKKRLAEEGREVLYSELQACDPESALRLHPNDTQRLLRALEIYEVTGMPWSRHLQQQTREPVLTNFMQIGLNCDREILYQRINLRVGLMVEQGLLAEVEKLMAMGYDGALNSMQSIGYRHMVNFLNNAWGWDEALALLARDTRRYAKRQLTWFGKDSSIKWFAAEQGDDVCRAIDQFMK
ncbi:MAG: tRNA (adenosine(37)-N6)-dimethylallyltransferase MiaA [Desulfobulbaceae bacterium]|nr:tRNA (adenosine(37)-N6)-dimethylallyltransferase MiaA [Desulfobulbaceae bacterium]HIJ79110.1 tRNA (adenosine(37)-N6)-dimethylallyltransferase MiaA [Deltaproteobacteria bacterium]